MSIGQKIGIGIAVLLAAFASFSGVMIYASFQDTPKEQESYEISSLDVSDRSYDEAAVIEESTEENPVEEAAVDEEPSAQVAEETVIVEEQLVDEKGYESDGPVASFGYISGSTFKYMGVVYYNNTRFTYYSSNAAYHYRTPEWTPDADGFYRDSNGYYVIAHNTLPHGSVVETPWGLGMVYDYCGTPGTIDMYVNF